MKKLWNEPMVEALDLQETAGGELYDRIIDNVTWNDEKNTWQHDVGHPKS